MQKLKTRVIRKDVNPEWNEDLTLSVSNPDIPVKLVCILVTETTRSELDREQHFYC